MPLKMSPTGKVLCDKCETDSEVKTYNCPFKFCSQIALCRRCAHAAPSLHTKNGHRKKGCEEQKREHSANDRQRQQLSAAGRFILASGKKVGSGLILCIFRSGLNRQARFIPEIVYRKRSEITNPTIEDFEYWAGVTLPAAPLDEEDVVDMQSTITAARRMFEAIAPQMLLAQASESKAQPNLFHL